MAKTNGTNGINSTAGMKLLDMNVVSAMTEPLSLTIYRLHRDPVTHKPEAPEAITPSVQWTKELLLQGQLAPTLISYAGGGVYDVRVADARGVAITGMVHCSGPEVVPPDVAVMAAAAGAQSRAANQAAQQHFGGGVPAAAGGGGGPAPWQQFIQNAQAAQQQAQQQQQQQQATPFSGSAPPQGTPWSAPGFPPWMQNAPWMQGLFGQPVQGGFGQPVYPGTYNPYQPQQPFSPYQPQQLPPYIPQGSGGSGLSPAMEAELAQLKQQNAQLREDSIRREQQSSIDRLATEMRTYMAAADQRFNALVEKLTAGRGQSGDRDEFALKLAGIERDRQLDMQRLEAQRREEHLRAEMQRIADETKRQNDQLQLQLAAAKESNDAKYQQIVMDRMAQVQDNAAKMQREAYERTLTQTPGVVETLRLFKELNGDDPFAQRLKEFALETLAAGGQGGGVSTAQVVGQLGTQLLDGAKSIANTVIDSKRAEGMMKAQQDAKARQQLENLRQVQRQAAAQAAEQLGVTQQPRQVAGQPSPAAVPPIGAAEPQPQPAEPTNAQEYIESEERPYFGDAYEPLKQMRARVASGDWGVADVVEAIVQSFIYYHNMGSKFPALGDMQADPEKFIRRALPDVMTAFRAEVLDKFPGELAAALEELVSGNEEAAS